MDIGNCENIARETVTQSALRSHATSWTPSQSCSNCPNRDNCLPARLTATEYSRFERIVRSRKIQYPGDILYRQHGPCHSIFAIRTGSIKLTAASDNGVEQIFGFHFPGQVIGFDGIAAGAHTSDAMAMEPSTVCEIPFDALCKLSSSLPNLQSRFFRLMSSEIIDDHKLLRLLGKGQAVQRVAAFLLAMSEMYRERGRSATRFRLPMARSDIASYLGLTIETTSRCFSEFARSGTLTASRNDIELLDMGKLRRTVDGMAFDE